MIIYENKCLFLKRLWLQFDKNSKQTLNFGITETGSNELRFGRFKNWDACFGVL
jgi:hypothetical protein